MTRHRLSLYPLLLALTLAAGTPALAQAPLGFREAVATVLAENPQARAADRLVEAARARELGAAALPNPNLTLMVDQVPFENPGNGNYMAGLSQPLLLGGQREAQLQFARTEIRLAELDREILRRDLAARAQDAYAQLLYEQENAQAAKSSLETAVTLLEAAQARYKAGEVPRVEVFRAEVEHGNAERAVEAAASKVATARGRLNVLLGRAAQAPLAIEKLPLPDVKRLPAVEHLVARSLASRPELVRAELVIQREALQRRLAQAGLWTGSEVTGAFGTVAGLPAITTTLTLPVPIYRQEGAIAEAEANRAAAEAQRDALKHEVSLDVEQAYREASLAARQAERFRGVYLPQAERLVDNARRRFLAGEGTGVEVIEARHALRDAQAAYQQAILEYRQALHALERAVAAPLDTVGKDTP